MRPAFLSRRGPRIALAGVAVLLVLLLVAALLLLSFGWTWLRHPIEQRLSARLGRQVTIASIRRLDHGLLDATLAIDGIRVAQPGWVGGGDFASVRRATVILPILPVLRGAIRAQSVELEGLRVHLIRRDSDHANWKDIPGGKGGKGGKGPGPAHVVIRDGQLRFDDYKRDHFFTAGISADDRAFRLAGTGTLIGKPTTLALTAPGLAGRKPWPFRLDYRSPIANATLVGQADTPLSLGHFSAQTTAWGDDLKHLDLIVEAGLPGTAPARIVADVRHDARIWTLRSFALTLGRSQATGALAITLGDRTKLTGKVVASALDFDDLANAEGRAKAAAKRAAAPDRRIPETRIALDHLLRTDGDLDIEVHRLLFRAPSAARSVRGHMALDHGVLTLSPFVTTLESGTLSGLIRITQVERATRLHLDLRLAGSRIESLATDPTAFSGALAGRFLLDGTGATIRRAIGTASGRVAIVGHDGTLGRKTALLLGQDIGRGLRAQAGEVARLRCGIGSFIVQGGQARPAPVIIDTSVARAEATGLLDLTDERMDLAVTGAPKQPSALRLSGPIRVTGALFTPTVSAPAATSTKGIFRSIRQALSGKPLPLAADADCAGLAARALR
ncbi:AsmA family protein [Sphingomonas sp. BIUV-7]|uniref:AsmA family protein n=1 Tax=Sphingomonas natans TaxID=3063330 RepID=A0ABT8YE24_9SPHN|nr:AsmA family protein [Sphingomonas sp. BIUV-7]MDO6416590.1 AsmA family protein [Sphingomonas sp. BIUV-7]